MGNWFHRTRFAIALGAVLTSVLSCSLLVDTGVRVQCATTADCDANPLFAGRICELGFCAVKDPQLNPTDEEDGGEPCVNTTLCTQGNSGKASVCRVAGEPCIPWEIEGCRITGRWDDPAPIMIGALLPLNFPGPGGVFKTIAYAERLQRAISLAVEELDEKNPIGFQIGGTQRPVAVLACDSLATPDVARQRFDHLTQVVGAKAVIVGWDDDLSAIAAAATERQTTIICSDCLAPFPPGPTAWRIIPSITLEAPLVAWRVADLEAKIKALDPSDIRVTLLTEGLTVPKAFSAALLETLRFNDESAVGQAAFQTIQTADPRVEVVDHLAIASAIAAFAPHIIVAGMGSGLPEYYLKLIEDKWPSGQPRPYYIGTQLNYEVGPFRDRFLTNDDLRRRFSGTFPRVQPELADNITGFEVRYEEANGKPADGTFSGYEAFYATAFAIAAAGTKNPPTAPFDGPFISSGFSSLIAGPVVNFAPGEIAPGLTQLRGTGSIDVRGLTTDLDWDPVTRDLSPEMAMYCFGREDDKIVLKRDPGGVHYSPKTKTVDGVYACE